MERVFYLDDGLLTLQSILRHNVVLSNPSILGQGLNTANS
jgi:hypothetical protein